MWKAEEYRALLFIIISQMHTTATLGQAVLGSRNSMLQPQVDNRVKHWNETSPAGVWECTGSKQTQDSKPDTPTGDVGIAHSILATALHTQSWSMMFKKRWNPMLRITERVKINSVYRFYFQDV